MRPAPEGFNPAMSDVQTIFAHGEVSSSIFVEISSSVFANLMRMRESFRGALDRSGIRWRFGEGTPSKRELDAVADAILPMSLQDPGTGVYNIHVGCQLKDAPPVQDEAYCQSFYFIQNRNWKGSVGFHYTEGKPTMPTDGVQRDRLFRRAFGQLRIPEAWARLSSVTPDSLKTKPPPQTSYSERGVDVKIIGMDKFGPLSLDVTPPEKATAVEMFCSIKDNLMETLYHYDVVLDGPPERIGEFAETTIGPFQTGSFHAFLHGELTVEPVREIDRLSDSFRVTWNVYDIEGFDDLGFDLTLAKEHGDYSVDIFIRGHRNDMNDCVDRIREEWNLDFQYLGYEN